MSWIACTSRVVEVKNTSSASANSSIVMSRSCTSYHSITSSRVTPAKQPADSGGVTTVPSKTQKTLVPVPSHRLPAVLAKIASLAPRSAAYASAITLSAYDVVLSPAVAPFSLRGHGTTTPFVDG